MNKRLQIHRYPGWWTQGWRWRCLVLLCDIAQNIVGAWEIAAGSLGPPRSQCLYCPASRSKWIYEQVKYSNQDKKKKKISGAGASFCLLFQGVRGLQTHVAPTLCETPALARQGSDPSYSIPTFFRICSSSPGNQHYGGEMYTLSYRTA